MQYWQEPFLQKKDGHPMITTVWGTTGWLYVMLQWGLFYFTVSFLSKVKLHLDKEKGVQKGSQNLDPAYSYCFSTRRPCLLILFASEHYLVKTELCLRRKRHDSLKMLLRTKSATETEFTRKARHVAKRHFLNYSCITNQPKYFCLNNAKDSK